MPTMPDEKKLIKRVSISEPDVGDDPDRSWHTKCALLYKGSAWHPEERFVFPDAASALAHFAAKNLVGQRRWGNVILWTGEIPNARPRTRQTFTAYPLHDGPRRIEIEDKYYLDWAFIAFADKKTAAKPTPNRSKDVSKEDARLATALTEIRFMGYHVDVWTCRDSDSWDSAMRRARNVKTTKYVAGLFRTPEYDQRRKKYEAFIRHGVAGFSRDDIARLDKIQNEDEATRRDASSEEDYDYADDGYEHDGEEFELIFVSSSQPRPEEEPEFHGFLEHQEETIIEDDGKAEEKLNENAEIDVDPEDLDMAARLAGASIN